MALEKYNDRYILAFRRKRSKKSHALLRSTMIKKSDSGSSSQDQLFTACLTMLKALTHAEIVFWLHRLTTKVLLKSIMEIAKACCTTDH